jgi:hypothetical protein
MQTIKAPKISRQIIEVLSVNIAEPPFSKFFL